MSDASPSSTSYPPEFLATVDKFIELANELARGQHPGTVSAAILFAAGRYNAFNYLQRGGDGSKASEAAGFYVDEYRKAFLQNLSGAVGPVIDPSEGKEGG